MSTVTTKERKETVGGVWGRLFTPPEVDVSTVRTYNHKFYPAKVPTKMDSFYDFDLGSLGEKYLVLSSLMLYVRGRMVREDGTAIAKGEKICLVNNAISSLFKSVTLVLGRNQLEMTESHYPYTNYINMLTWVQDDVSITKNYGWLLDFPYEGGDVSGWNEGCFLRAKWLSDAPDGYELKGRLGIDLLTAESYLVPSTPFKLTLVRTEPSFYCLKPADSEVKYNFEIDDVYITGSSVQTIKMIRDIIGDLMAGSEEEVETKNDETGESTKKKVKYAAQKANYRYDSLVTRWVAVPQNTNVVNFPNMYEGVVPRKLLIAFITQEAKAGNDKLNPFSFDHVSVKSVTVTLDGQPVGSLTTDFERGFILDAYDEFLHWGGLEEAATPIRRDNFAKGNTFLCYDNMKNCSEGKTCTSELMQSGNMALQVQLKDFILKPYIMMVFGTRASNMTLDDNRNAEVRNSTV